MKLLLSSMLFLLAGCISASKNRDPIKIFDVHIHGAETPVEQLKELRKNGVYKAALSSSWEAQESYRNQDSLSLLYGLMFPCSNGKVPYSLQPCFQEGQAYPTVDWVEQQIQQGKIDFLGEVLSQYYGISSSDTSLYPYYKLAEKYGLPVGIHTGGAGPDHGAPDFKWEMGKPSLLGGVLQTFPSLKLWIMHGGDQYYEETIAIMKEYPSVYADISVLCNPAIVPAERFESTLLAFLNAGFENRLLFGSDNGPIENCITAIEKLSILTKEQKDKIYFKNAEDFFATR